MKHETTEQAAIDRYQYLARWHIETGSLGYYIRQQCLKALEENAPLNAIYKRDDGAWATTDDISNPDIITRWNLPIR